MDGIGEIDRTRNFVMPAVFSGVAVGLMIVLLYLLDRIWWCKLGDYAVYVNDAWSTHTSQHLFDPYTFTHVLHGVMYFWIARLVFPKLPVWWQGFIAIFAEAAWEVLENTNWVIEKYRSNTASLDYFGDSILNSVGDVVACAAGIWFAVRFGWWRSVVFFVLVEVVLLIWIRDSLLLNILMLVFPLDSIKHWQMQ